MSLSSVKLLRFLGGGLWGRRRACAVVTCSLVTNKARLASLGPAPSRPGGPSPRQPCSQVLVGSCPAGPAEARDPHAAPSVFSVQGMGFPNRPGIHCPLSSQREQGQSCAEAGRPGASFSPVACAHPRGRGESREMAKAIRPQSPCVCDTSSMMPHVMESHPFENSGERWMSTQAHYNVQMAYLHSTAPTVSGFHRPAPPATSPRSSRALGSSGSGALFCPGVLT